MKASLTAGALGGRARLVRVIWIVTALLALGTFIASIPALLSGALIDPRFTVTGAWVSALYAASVLASILSVSVSLFLAALIMLRKPGDRMAVFVSFYLLVYGIALGGPLEVLELAWRRSTDIALLIQTMLLTGPTFAFFGLFPNGRFVPRWTRGLTLFATAASLTTPFVSSPEALRSWSSPAALAFNLLLGVLIFIGVFAQIYRYRKVSTPAERQQTKWAVFGVFLWLALITLEGVPYIVEQQLPPGSPKPWWTPIGNTTWFLTIGILPVSLTIAILRSGLWDIDLLIRRTLVYGTLTATLASLYYASVVLLQQLFRVLTGQQQTDVVIVLSTLAIAALFAPLRRRLQQGIDRRFYRRKYDAQAVLTAFGARVRDEVDLNQLNEELLTVVEQTMQPASVGLWLRESDPERKR